MTAPSPPRQIVALGGGGFSEEPDNPALDRYILGLARRDEPRVCFIPTASGDAQSYVDRFYAAFAPFPCTPTHLSLFQTPPPDVAALVREQDVLYVGGGNTRNLLVLWREWGLDRLLRQAWEGGAVLAGISAGSICWFEGGVSDSVLPGALAPLDCLGFLPGSNCPHYDSEAERRPTYQRLIAAGALPDGYAADDGVALHFVGDRVERVVSSRPHANAYRVERRGDDAVETALSPVVLGPASRP